MMVQPLFQPVYLDHNATTPLDPAVLAAMLPWLNSLCGNASSRHEYGRRARLALDEARQKVAAALGAHPTEVLFTSGGSEANNLFIKGAAASLKPGLLAHSAIEHPCVLKPAAQLARQGWVVREIAVDAAGQVKTGEYAELLLEKPKLLSVMLANNETGVVQDIAALAVAARSSGAWFHSDVVQAFGKLPVDFRLLNAAGVHAVTVSAHKINGPKGAAALVLDKRIELQPQIAGGGHERGLRSGTENVPAIVGFGVAAELAAQRVAELRNGCSILKNRLESGVTALGARIFAVDARVCPIPAISPFPISTVKRWSASWTAKVLPWPAGPLVPVPTRSRRTYCGRWVWPRKSPVARCGSVLAPATAKRISNNSSTPCRLQSDACRD
jgi:cysteine desulfurase